MNAKEIFNQADLGIDESELFDTSPTVIVHSGRYSGGTSSNLPFDTEENDEAGTADEKNPAQAQQPSKSNKKDKKGGKGEEEMKVADVSVDKVRWLFQHPTSGWILYPQDASREIEEAFRDGKTAYSLRIGSQGYKLQLGAKKVRFDGDEKDLNLRRHIVKDGLEGQWELIVTKFKRMFSMSGAAAIKLLEKVWSNNETFRGDGCGLGFIFLYNLLSGETRVKVLGSDYGSSSYGSMMGGGAQSFMRYGGNTSLTNTNDSHRFATLIAQLYSDRRSKSLPASVVNVLVRNRQVSMKMPKFRDTRKTQSAFHVGWSEDDSNRQSPIADLFSKLVPLMVSLKRKGALHFPPPPPHPELPSLPTATVIPANLKVNADCQTFVERAIPEISDFGCDARIVQSVQKVEINDLITATKSRMRSDKLKPRPPIHIEDPKHLNDVFAADPDKMIVLYFAASWCGPCQAFAPVFRLLAM